MIISRILYPVHSLGPGERVCLWTQGCSKKCKNCMTPEMQPFSGMEIEESKLAKILIATSRGNGELTISGGDPFEQPTALYKLLNNVRAIFSDILVYTGYELGELRNLGKTVQDCLSLIDVLIDGRYVDELNFPNCILRGSTNQRIHYFDESLQMKYESYCSNGRIIEPFSHGGKTIVTGILNKEISYE